MVFYLSAVLRRNAWSVVTASSVVAASTGKHQKKKR
jgi:hypothetical protein